MKRFRHVLAVALIVFGTAGCDQGTKYWARRTLAAGPVELFGGRLQLVLTSNRGAFLSMGAGLSDPARSALFTVGLSAVLVAAIAWLLLRRGGSPVETVALASILGGGAGNVIDRLLRSGAVTDFLFVQVGPLHTGVFNVADLCVTAGALTLLLWAGKLRASPPR